ncbi:MAG: hypothetical protein V1844_15165 [Pseudomonadota bacterium]
MILYLDTSSLVKLYMEEEASPEIVTLVRSSEATATSIHLASALILHQEVSTPVVFSCFDSKLEKAAMREGLDI